MHSATTYQATEANQTSRNTGPLGSGTYHVQPGECFLSIAYQHGFFWKTLWDLPQNKPFRDVRQDPGLLIVGDRVAIPELETKEVSACTEARHRFVKRGVSARLRLIIEYEDMPVSNKDYVLVLDGNTQTGTTDKDGLIETSIPCNARRGYLDIDGLHFELEIGALDPHSEDFGIQQRLANLGFYHGALDGIIGPLTRQALAAFQARTNLNVTGQLDDQTRPLLLHRHDEIHERLPVPPAGAPPAPSEESNHG